MAGMTVEHTQSSSRRGWKWALVAAVCVAGSVLWGRLQGLAQDSQPAPSSQRVVEATPSPSALSPEARARSAGQVKPGQAPEGPSPTTDAPAPGTPAALPPEYIGSRDHVRRKVLAANKDLEDYKFFEQKILRTPGETQAFQAMLASTERLDRAVARLTSSGETAYSSEVELERMYQVDYLEQALRWKENPERERVFALAEQIILADNLVPTLPIELRRSLAGDKLELYAVLQAVAPERAQRIAERARGSGVEKLLAFAGSPTVR